VTRFDFYGRTMSTSNSARQTPVTSPHSRLLTVPVLLVLVSGLCMLTSFFLLVSVTPMETAASGGGSAGAGLVTGVLLLGTVLAELASSWLMRRCGYRLILAAGAAAMGLASVGLLAHGSLTLIVIASLVRGFGFGLGTVVLGALIVVLVPADRRGEGIALFGVADAIPAVIALPSGLWLADHAGFTLVVLLTAVTALVPLAACASLPGRDGGESAGEEIGLLAGLRQGGQLRPAMIFAASTVAAGVVASFLPLAAGVSKNVAAGGLLAQALTATAGRWLAGRLGDRHGHARLFAPALAFGAAGMAGMLWLASPVAVIAGMCVFGFGFGLLENSTFALMMERMPAAGYGTASAIWSLAYDGGYGAGPAAFGLFVGVTGYPVAFALSGLLMIAVVPVARREARPARVASAGGGANGRSTEPAARVS
jgi:MFS family permease